ncbi:hypothetical protein OT109_07245 [Phycisphaeraceae bacterium D3-23]
MPMRLATFAFLFFALAGLSPCANAQGLEVALAQVLGEAQPDERILAGGADRVGGLRWLDRESLIVFGDDGRGFFDDVEETDDGFDPDTGEHRTRYVYRIDAESGERAPGHTASRASKA